MTNDTRFADTTPSTIKPATDQTPKPQSYGRPVANNAGSVSAIDKMIKHFARLPGIGQRSAKRMTLQLLKQRDGLMQSLIDTLQEAAETVHTCHVCGNLDTQLPCGICSNEQRNKGQICVVEGVDDLWALERGRHYHGKYHVLGGLLSALEGVTPQDLQFSKLLQRLNKGDIQEVIIALGGSVEGQSTAFYLADLINQHNDKNPSSPKIRITHLARGVPIGGELNYLDDGTLAMAMQDRQPFS